MVILLLIFFAQNTGYEMNITEIIKTLQFFFTTMIVINTLIP